MESIIHFRQMMADQKYFELQKLIEVQLSIKTEARHELLILYYESLLAQEKTISPLLALELAEFESAVNNHDIVSALLQLLPTGIQSKFYVRITRLKIMSAEKKGQMNDLYQLLSDLLVSQFERKIPQIHDWGHELIAKYYAHDFNLGLKRLALSLLTYDIRVIEKNIRDLILISIEKSSPKSISAKISSVGEVLVTAKKKGRLEIFQNFCRLYSNGIKEKNDIKNIVEMVIFFDDFKFQTLILNLMHQNNLISEAQTYASDIRNNTEYDFVYFDKYFSVLKSYFFSATGEEKEEDPVEDIRPDLKLNDTYKQDLLSSQLEVEENEDERKYLNVLKYQTYSSEQLCDLSVSFLQSEMPKVALKAAELAIEQAKDNESYLKGSYLKLSSLMLLKDFRAALDTCNDALFKAKTKDDILSFLYGQAEAYIRLEKIKDGKNILQQILSIDSDYRLAKERLDRLNEI